tara:strand:- start:39 stop:629 length:591 start_codon:yes stop_codon:yes gene_type:complete
MEYAGAVDFYFNDKRLAFDTPTFVTSKKRSTVLWEHIQEVWPQLIVYHTHPKCDEDPDGGMTATLPSTADFYAFIKLFPQAQVNIICDAHGYYVIDILDSWYKFTTPTLSLVEDVMSNFRALDEVKSSTNSTEESLEYFKTTQMEWKNLVNCVLYKELNRLCGIAIQYYSYFDEPAVVRIDTCQFNWKIGPGVGKI